MVAYKTITDNHTSRVPLLLAKGIFVQWLAESGERWPSRIC